MARSLLMAIALASTLLVLGCTSGNQPQQPSAEEQKRIQDEQQKAIEQEKTLTSGYGNSMNHVAPNTGYAPDNNKQQALHPKSTQHQTSQPQH